MAIEKAKIPSRRDRIQVSPERRDQARAGMGGEQVKTAGATILSADAASAPVKAPVTPAPLEPTPAPIAAPEPAATAPALNSTPAPSLPFEPAAEPTPAPAQTMAAADAPVPAARTTTPTAGRRRGRKPAAPDAILMEPERSVKIPESVWNDIRLALVLLPKGEDSPANIKAYLVAAHRAYDTQLRKQGKLPAKQADAK